MGPDPEEMVRMAEATALLDALEERVPEDPELRDGLADLVFHGSLQSEFATELAEVYDDGFRMGPPGGMGYP